jgi:hypothetical protein
MHACGAILALCLVAARPAPESAKDFVARVYAPYLKGGDGWFVRAKEDHIRKVFIPALADAIWKQFQEADDRHEVPLLNGDPLVNAQEWKFKSLDADVRLATSDIAIATVSILLDDGPRLVVLNLRLGRDGWRIAEVEFEDGLTLSDLLASRPTGRPGGARSLIGGALPKDQPKDLAGPFKGGMVFDDGEHGLVWWQGKARAAAFLERMAAGGGQLQLTVLDAVDVELPPGASLYPLCQSEGIKEDRYQIVALLRPTGPCSIMEGIKTEMLRGWKVDLVKKRLTPIPIRGLSCAMACDK